MSFGLMLIFFVEFAVREKILWSFVGISPPLMLMLIKGFPTFCVENPTTRDLFIFTYRFPVSSVFQVRS